MKTFSCVLLSLAAFLSVLQGCASQDATKTGDNSMNPNIVFATYAVDRSEVNSALRLTESLRTFGGQFAQAPLWIVAPDDLEITDALQSDFRRLGITLLRAGAPDSIRWLYYADKPYAAAAAEQAADGKAAVLAWMDNDAIILDEPSELNLGDSLCLAYRPVMHNRSGSLYGEPPDPFWARIYEKLELNDDQLFPMVTPADQQKIRAYFHCGLVAVRPERGILRRWAQDFETLANDSVLTGMCKQDEVKRIFLHQTALTGSVLHLVKNNEMAELSDRYNYPLFFKHFYGALKEYDDLSDIVLARVHLNPVLVSNDWPQLLKGPADRIAWLKDHI